jgi:hypothetical protein
MLLAKTSYGILSLVDPMLLVKTSYGTLSLVDPMLLTKRYVKKKQRRSRSMHTYTNDGPLIFLMDLAQCDANM